MAGRPPSREPPPFGARLAAQRKKQGLSQAQLAERLGMTQKGIDYYERRARNPSLEFIQNAARVLDVTVAELVGEESSRPPKSKPGPPSRLEQRIEQLRRLPRKDQEFVLRMLDTVLESAERT